MLILGQQHLHNLPMKQFPIYHNNYTSFCLSSIILICKLIVLIGLFIAFFSDHWALSLHSPNIYAGYKNRCTVHYCTPNNTDPVWLIDIACLLAIINFKIELINIILHYCYIDKASKLKIIIEGCMCLSTFILTICLVIFFIYLSIYAYDLPMGYAYSCFVVSIYFSTIDIICLLKRFIINWPKTIYLSGNELSLHNHSTIHIVRRDSCTSNSSNSITMNMTYV